MCWKPYIAVMSIGLYATFTYPQQCQIFPVLGKTFPETFLVELLSRCVNIAPISHLGRTIFYLFRTHVGILWSNFKLNLEMEAAASFYFIPVLLLVAVAVLSWRGITCRVGLWKSQHRELRFQCHQFQWQSTTVTVGPSHTENNQILWQSAIVTLFPISTSFTVTKVAYICLQIKLLI